MKTYAVNALFMIPGQVGGTETYLRRTLAALPALLAPDERLVVFASAENISVLLDDLRASGASCREQRSADVCEVVGTGVRAVSRVRRLAFENFSLPRLLRSHSATALWNPGNSAVVRAPCPQVTTVHDMQYERFPEDFSTPALFAMRALVPAAVRRSAVTIAVSEFSRVEILRFVHGADPRRVVAVPEAADPFFAAPPTDPEGAAAEARLLSGCSRNERFALVVSNSYPHKSLETAVFAFSRLAQRFPDLRLVVLGRARRGEGALLSAIRETRAGERVVRLDGGVSRERLSALYRAAELLLFPSRYEGFGLPVLEAMSAGLRVVAARAGSVPEVAGEAALLCPPGDAAAMAGAAASILSDPALAERLRAAGRARAAAFSWERSAAGVLAALRQSVG